MSESNITKEQILLKKIQEDKILIDTPPKSRKLAVVKTKLDEAELWLIAELNNLLD